MKRSARILGCMVALSCGWVACAVAPAAAPPVPVSPPRASSGPPVVRAQDLDGGPPEARDMAAPDGGGPAAPLVEVEVAGDRAAHVVQGAPGDSRALVYLPGRCGDDLAFQTWSSAAARWGTLVVLLGDEPCRGTSRYRWGTDLAHIERRIGAALAAVSATRAAPLDARVITLIGYSEGATRAEQLVQRAPSRYPRVILGGAPRQPSLDRLRQARAVVVLAGEHDRRSYLEEGALALAKVRVPVAFRVLPGAGHGEYGPEGDRVMGEALAWVFATAP